MDQFAIDKIYDDIYDEVLGEEAELDLDYWGARDPEESLKSMTNRDFKLYQEGFEILSNEHINLDYKLDYFKNIDGVNHIIDFYLKNRDLINK